MTLDLRLSLPISITLLILWEVYPVFVLFSLFSRRFPSPWFSQGRLVV